MLQNMDCDSRKPFMRPYNRSTDIETVVDIICSSMINIAFYEQSLPLRKQFPLEYWKVTSRKVRTLLSLPNTRAFVAEDPVTHRVVGIAAWEAEGLLAEKREWRVDSFSKWLERNLTTYERIFHEYMIDRVSNLMAYQLFKQIEDEKFEVPKACESGYLGLIWLCIDPAQQKRGIGAMLLQWGLDLGTKYGVPVCLSSSEFGVRLYQRAGFKAFDYIELSVGKTDMRMPCMLWEPPQSKGQFLDDDGNGGWRLRPEFIARAQINFTQYTVS